MRRVHLPRSPHRQIALIGGLGAVTAVVVLALGFGQLQTADRELTRLDQQLLPASRALGEAHRDFNRGEDAFDRLTNASIPATQRGSLSGVVRWTAAAQRHLVTFRSHSHSLDGTRPLVDAVDDDRARVTAAAAALLHGGPEAVGAVNAYDAAAAALNRDMSALEARYGDAIVDATDASRASAHATQVTVLVAFTVALALFVTVTIGGIRISRQREREQAIFTADRSQQAARDELDARLQRGLEMARTEDAVFEVINAGLRHAVPQHDVELLVAESSRGHFRRVAGTTDPEQFGVTCSVSSPRECPAATRGQTLVFPTSRSVDTCPYLRHREAGPSSALCVPVTVTGKPTGVICAVGADGTPPDGDTQPVLELLARKTGERVTLLRSLARTESLASTDPLTGLLNRRSLEEQVTDLVEQGHAYVVAYGDLDHFKAVNDANGHDAGDRALRMFARVLRDNVRPGDFPSRYGGEEFVVVLPDCSVGDATTVVERVRTRLVGAARDAGVPPFTVSVGISAPDAGRPFGEVLGEADAALRSAKDAGRDRVVVAGATPGADIDPPVGTRPSSASAFLSALGSGSN